MQTILVIWNTMSEKKYIEIECPKCKTRFRLWVPLKLFSEWKNGEDIGCIKCGMRIRLEKDNDSFRVALAQSVDEIITEVEPKETAQAGEGVHLKNVMGETILIVDDDGLIRKMAEDELIKNNFTPLTAPNGPEALKLIEKNQIAVIVVDLHLKNQRDPESVMDGEELLQRLIDSGKDIPAVITTGKDLIDDIIFQPKWYDLNVKAFVQKGNPFWTDDLLAKIKEILKKD